MLTRVDGKLSLCLQIWLLVVSLMFLVVGVGSNEAAMVVVVVFVLTVLALSCQSDVPCSRR